MTLPHSSSLASSLWLSKAIKSVENIFHHIVTVPHNNLFHRLNKKLHGVTYNPVTMEYRTKWSHTHEPNSSRASHSKPATFSPGSRQQEQLSTKTTTGYDGFDKKAPYGQLAMKELVKRVKQARMQSPFADDFKENDPVDVDSLPASCLSSNGSCSSSNESVDSDLDEDTIHAQSVISSKKLSTSVFKNPLTLKKTREHDTRGRKVTGELTRPIEKNSIYSCLLTSRITVFRTECQRTASPSTSYGKGGAPERSTTYASINHDVTVRAVRQHVIA